MVSDPGGGDDWTPRQFSTWAPIALAGIGDQADTIHDRSVTVKMKRKPKMQPVEKLRGNRDYGFRELARKCARWAQDHVEALKDAEPVMPEVLHDRAQDNWEPLIAIADAAGGDWPKRARGCRADGPAGSRGAGRGRGRVCSSCTTSTMCSRRRGSSDHDGGSC